MPMKNCTGCAVAKPLDDFYDLAKSRRSRGDGKQARCKDCIKRASADRYSRNPEKQRAQRKSHREKNLDHYKARERNEFLKRRYGITHTQYLEMLTAQGGVCKICKTTECSTGKLFAVDHDHSCCSPTRACEKCIRGLLCADCNRGLGMFKDNPELLDSAKAYLLNSER
jgi:hypothetical protein